MRIIWVMMLFLVSLSGLCADSTNIIPPTNVSKRLLSQTFLTIPIPADNLIYQNNQAPAKYTMPKLPSDWTCKTAMKLPPVMQPTALPVCTSIELRNGGQYGIYSVSVWGNHEVKYVYNRGGCWSLAGSSKVSDIEPIIRNSGLSGSYFQTGGAVGHPTSAATSCTCLSSVNAYRASVYAGSWVPASVPPSNGDYLDAAYQIVCEKWVSN